MLAKQREDLLSPLQPKRLLSQLKFPFPKTLLPRANTSSNASAPSNNFIYFFFILFFWKKKEEKGMESHDF